MAPGARGAESSRGHESTRGHESARNTEALNPGLEALLNVSNTGEPWTDEWHVIDTAVDFPGGGRAGFYRRAGKKGEANPKTGRDGILYLYPEGGYRPARILGKDVVLPKENPRLELGVAANWNPRGEWKLVVKVDGQQLFNEAVITSGEGWQDLVFDLAGHGGRRVEIVIEASGGNRSYSYVFIDYIRIGSGPSPSVPGSDRAASTGEKGSVDQPYQNFLEQLETREEKRSQRVQDQVYQDQQKDESLDESFDENP